VITYGLRNALLRWSRCSHGLLVPLGANVAGGENVFAWPGVGSYALEALIASDYAPVQARAADGRRSTSS